MGAISCRQRTIRSGGRVELALEKRELARWEVEGRVRAQLNVAMYAVRSAMVCSIVGSCEFEACGCVLREERAAGLSPVNRKLTAQAYDGQSVALGR